MTEQYNALMAAIRLLSVARLAVSREDGPDVTSPAWSMLHHAHNRLTAQAARVLRGEEVDQ